MQEISETLLGFFEMFPVIIELLKTTESAQFEALFLNDWRVILKAAKIHKDILNFHLCFFFDNFFSNELLMELFNFIQIILVCKNLNQNHFFNLSSCLHLHIPLYTFL